MSIESFILARVAHIVGVVIWIGGVFFVTFVLLPALKNFPLNERLSVFERLEHRFGYWARLAIIMVGISGLLLANQIGFWQRLAEKQLWPIHLMLFVWLIFFIMLFVLEPFIVHKLFHRYASEKPIQAIKVATVIHWVLCGLSFTAIIGGVMLAHGWSFY